MEQKQTESNVAWTGDCLPGLTCEKNLEKGIPFYSDVSGRTECVVGE